MPDDTPNVIVRETAGKGLSLFAAKPFKKDEFILVIAGPIVKKNERTRYTIPISYELAIDPVPVNTISRYLCHSCEPSAGIHQRTLVVAFRDIAAGEEVTIDYAMVLDQYENYFADPEFHKVMTEKDIVCHCGAVICRGEFGCYDKLSKELREKYEGYISDYLTSN